MKFSLLSLVAGNTICNARCPFCIARLTPKVGLSTAKPATDWRNFHKAAELALRGGAQTVMITGKGEPTLFPEQISDYLSELSAYRFPFIELQTNGILLETKRAKFIPYLERWRDLGLTTIAISVSHFLAEENRRIYTPHAPTYIDLRELITTLHEYDFTTRLALVMSRGLIDSPEGISQMIAFAKECRAEQLSIRPVANSMSDLDQETSDWIREHALSEAQKSEIEQWIRATGRSLYTYPHGAELFDIHGQNLCLTNCLTRNTSSEVRQLIFLPNGTLTLDWELTGGILLRGSLTDRDSEQGLLKVS